jgi:Rod binding domain-containing protein
VSEGLPPIDQSLIPAGVRAGGSKDVQLYEAALSFESMLTQQLTKSLTDTLQPSSDGDSDDGSSSDAGTSLSLSMLPQALSQDLESSGGLGLAPQLYQALGGTMSSSSGSAPTATPAETGGAK